MGDAKKMLRPARPGTFDKASKRGLAGYSNRSLRRGKHLLQLVCCSTHNPTLKHFLGNRHPFSNAAPRKKKRSDIFYALFPTFSPLPSTRIQVYPCQIATLSTLNRKLGGFTNTRPRIKGGKEYRRRNSGYCSFPW